MSASPRIGELEWGRIELEGIGRFKDVKVWPGGAREWDWSETGTHHEPGIQSADVEELISRGATVVVLGTGMQQRLAVTPQAIATLQAAGIEVEIHPTPEAVERYNELVASKAVAGLFHSTC